MTIDDFPVWARDGHWQSVVQQLESGCYFPDSVRRVEIDKPDGSVRLLGIPTIRDRVIQQAIAQVLTPIVDPEFSDNSFGFRPNRNGHQAVKGNKDRTTMLPQRLISGLHKQIEKVGLIHAEDIEDGYGDVYLPDALARKYPRAAQEMAWQFLFPSSKIGRDPRSGDLRRHHLHPAALSKQISAAVRAAGINKPAKSHSFRIAFA